MMDMELQIVFSREDDGRWIAEVVGLGVAVYGDTKAEAVRNAKASALRLLAFMVEEGEGRGRSLVGLHFSAV